MSESEPVVVPFAVPCEVAYDYLIDPTNRPAWQRSLKAVSDVVGETGVPGQRWTDLTKLGLRAAMELTVAQRPVRWTERGEWGPAAGELTLTFAPTPQGCTVSAALVVGPEPSRGWRGRMVNKATQRTTRRVIRTDLERAAGILAAAP